MSCAKKKVKTLPKPPQLVLPAPTRGLRLDAKPEGAAWNGAPELRFTSRYGAPAAYQTTARIAWSETHLFVAFVNHEPKMDRLTVLADAQAPHRSSPIWTDDSVEIFVCPSSDDRQRGSQYIVNAKGLTLGGHFEYGYTPGWAGTVEACVRAGDDHWTALVKIPFADMGIEQPVKGRTVALNLYRNRYCGGRVVYSCWSATGGRRHLSRERFGQVVFGP